MNSPQKNLRGILLAFTGFTFWVLADSSIKLLGNSHLPPYEVIAFMGLFLSAAIALYAALRGNMIRLKPGNPRHQAVRSMLDLTNNLCVVVALRHVSLPLFYILVFMAPPAITVLGFLFLHEKIGWRKGAASLAGFLGVVVAVNPFGTSRQGDWIGYAACMVCVACFSVNMVWSRVLTRTESPESLAFFSGGVMSVAGVIGMLWHAQPVGIGSLVTLLAMGLFCAVGSICFFLALRYTTASNVSQYHYTQLLTGSLVSYLVWREPPTNWMVMGGAIIVASGLYLAVVVNQDATVMH